MAIITISQQYGSRGEAIGRDVAARLGFELITPEKVWELIRERYQLEYSPETETYKTPASIESGKLFAGLISAILTDMALFGHLLILECGGQFIFKSFPNALHIRITAPRELRIANIAAEQNIPPEQAVKILEEHDLRQERFLRAGFRRSGSIPDRYDISINIAGLEIESAVQIIICAAREKKVEQYGMVSNETAERLKLRNQIRLQKALTSLSLEKNPSLNQFAHPSELLFARLMDFYGIRWEYEPRTFPLRYDESGNLLEAFSPDFYLPDSDLYVELTTMKQSLVTKKNRKVRRLQELYPDIRIRLLYQKDFEDLLFKYTARS